MTLDRSGWNQERMPEKHPDRAFWERLKFETNNAYEAFKIYRDLPLSKRKQTEVARRLGKSPATVHKWAKKYLWTARVEAKDAEEERREALEVSEDRRRMYKRHANVSRLFQNKVLERLQNLNPAELTPNQLAQWFEVSAKIERQAMGDSTETIEHVMSGAGSRNENDLTGAIFDNPDLAELAVRFMEQAGLSEDEPSGSS